MRETFRVSENHPMFAKHLSEDVKQKICDSLSGRKLTVEHTQKISEATSGEKHPLFGKKHTIEAREKMCGPRPSISGEKNPFFGKTLSAIPRLRRKLALESRRYAKIIFMSGTFHVPSRPEELIMRLIKNPHRAPSAGHTQVQEFIIVKDSLTKKKLRKVAVDQEYVESAPVLIRVCSNTSRSTNRYGMRGRGVLYYI